MKKYVFKKGEIVKSSEYNEDCLKASSQAWTNYGFELAEILEDVNTDHRDHLVTFAIILPAEKAKLSSAGAFIQRFEHVDVQKG